MTTLLPASPDALSADDAENTAENVPDVAPAPLSMERLLDFTLLPELEAAEPPEVRAGARDAVRLLVSQGAGAADMRITHAHFGEIGQFLQPGDALVINTSGVVNAALLATRPGDPRPLELHLSTRLPGGFWTVELRLRGDDDAAPSQPFHEDLRGATLTLPGGASATLHAPYPAHSDPPRLWLATLETPPLLPYLAREGFPIRYGYVRQPWPNSAYQTVYVTAMGSAEMPSAGRAFTHALMASLTARGVLFAPLLLHTGVSSLEAHEPPYAEWYHVPATTARLINATRAAGRRVVAVGTTSVRALETVSDERGEVHPGEGWTELVITPERGVRAVDGLLTGLHEPRSSHLAMLEALASRDHLARAYSEALRGGYLWHEFGDLHLLLP